MPCRRTQLITFDHESQSWKAKEQLCVCQSCLTGNFESCIESDDKIYSTKFEVPVLQPAAPVQQSVEATQSAEAADYTEVDEENSDEVDSLDSEVIEMLPASPETDADTGSFRLLLTPQKQLELQSSSYSSRMGDDNCYSSDIIEEYITLLKVNNTFICD